MYFLLDRRNSNAYNDRVWMHRGIYLLSKNFLVTPENIFHNILITKPLWHKVNNETSFQNSVQMHVFAQVSLTVFIFVCVLQNSHTLSSHFLYLCMSLFEPLKMHVSICMYKTSFNTQILLVVNALHYPCFTVPEPLVNFVPFMFFYM